MQAAAEKEQKIQQAKENLEVKRHQHIIELDLKRSANGEFDLEAFNKVVSEIQSKINDLDSAAITCVFAVPVLSAEQAGGRQGQKR